jgi:hypothetical protein
MRRTGLCLGLVCCILVQAVALQGYAQLAFAQANPQPSAGPQAPGQPGAWGANVRPQVPAQPAQPTVPPFKGTNIETPANTTIISRPSTESRTGGQVTLSAKVTEDGTDIETGVIWRIYRDKPGADGKLRLLSQHRDAAPQLRLDVGDYLVHVAYGRASLTRKITVAAGKAVNEKFVINAGGLKVAAVLASGEAVPDNAVVYSVLSDERDQFGNRITVLSGARPGVTMRLNAGLYQVQSTYGDANAVVRGEVAVEPGKVTEATLVHSAARATFRLVMRPGSEALADTQWSIVGSQGETVKESAGALPTHVLAPGIYAVVAKRFGQSFRREFTVQAGETVNVEIVAQQQ